MDLRSGSIVERYTVVREIGRGGLATVYEVEHCILGTRHALKVLRDIEEGSTERLLREGKLQARLDSTYVVPVTDVLDVEGRPALLMPLVDGGSLHEVLQHDRLPEGEIASIFVAIRTALFEAHTAGVVHRDLKPANVLLARRGDAVAVRVADFGLAADGSSKVRAFLGTPAYAAPEQIDDPSSVDARADLWSLGVVLYEMLVGDRPFAAPDTAGIFQQVRDGRYDAHRLPDRWRPVVEGLLTIADCRTIRPLPVDPAPLSARSALAFSLAASRQRRRRWKAGRRAEPSLTLTPEIDPPSPPADRQSPAEPDGLLGRQTDLDRLVAALHEGARLVTLVGPEGCGKTHLADHQTQSERERWPGGVWRCNLSSVRGIDGFTSAMARTLAIAVTVSDPIDAIGHALAGRGQCLVVLDGFERLVTLAPATVDRWLQLAPRAQVLVTSQRPLGRPAEQVLRLDPLSESDGIALFRHRARAAAPSFVPRPAAVARLVRLLDGRPLAIEIAAARPHRGPPERLADEIANAQDASGPSERLHALLGGVCRQLAPDDAAALARLSVFEGSFSLEAAGHVLDIEAPRPCLQALIDAALVRETPDHRFVVKPTVRAYARGRLVDRGEVTATEARHGAWYARMGDARAIRHLRDHGPISQYRTLQREVDNLVAASERAVGRGDGRIATNTVIALWYALRMQGAWVRARPLAMAVRQLDLRDPDVGRMELVLGRINAATGSLAAAERHYQNAYAAARRLGDEELKALAFGYRVDLALARGRIAEARQYGPLALAMAQERGMRMHEAYLLGRLARLDSLSGNHEGAMARCEAALAICVEHGNLHEQAQLLEHLGWFAMQQGQYRASVRWLEGSLDAQRTVGSRLGQSSTLASLGAVAFIEGRYGDAQTLYEDSLRLARQVGSRRTQATALSHLGRILTTQGDPEEGLRVLEAARALFASVGHRKNEASLEALLGETYEALDRPDDASTAYQRGLALARERQQPLVEGILHWHLAELMNRRGEARVATTHFDRSERMLRKVGDPRQLAEMLARRAAYEQARGQTVRARKRLADAERLVSTIEVPARSVLGVQLARARAAITASLER